MNPSYVSKCAQIASVLEVSGHPKPGNVHRTRNFPDMVFEDFLLSGIAIGETMEKAAEKGFKYRNMPGKWDKIGLGKMILEAVRETDHWVANNTNLGIVMLLTPISVVAGMFDLEYKGEPNTPKTRKIGETENNEGYPITTKGETKNKAILKTRSGEGTENRAGFKIRSGGLIERWDEFRDIIDQIMRSTTSKDAVNLYRAINIADAGGMGEKDDLDVAAESSLQKLREDDVNMFSVLEMSASWDKLSYELTHKMPVTFQTGYPVFQQVKSKNGQNEATVQTFLTILSQVPDTLISRKFGEAKAGEVSASAMSILKEGGILTRRGTSLVGKFDQELIKDGLNPGTTADFTASSIMVAYLDGYREYTAKLH